MLNVTRISNFLMGKSKLLPAKEKSPKKFEKTKLIQKLLNFPPGDNSYIVEVYICTGLTQTLKKCWVDKIKTKI
jgi:hypothetical protein